MSEDDSADDPNNSEEDSIKFDENFIIKLTNESNNIIDRNAKQTCKILQIPSELNIDLKLSIISKIEPSEYPNLFMFIIEHQNGALLTENQGTKAQQLDEHLKKFGATRPLIIQQICEAENMKKCYYKGKGSCQIVDIIHHYLEDYELYGKWQNTLSSLLDQEMQRFEDEMLIKLSFIQDNSIILRFLRTLNVEEPFFGSVALNVAKNGSKADLLAILDASFEDNGRILNNQAQNYIKQVFEDDESGSESSDASDEDQVDVEPTLRESSNDIQQDNLVDETSSQSESEDSNQSVLLTAVQHSNQEIIDYLITYCTHLLQQLPVEHQIRISSTAFDTNQFDVLCDLLEYSDFPFPDGLNVTNDQVIHERLQKIIRDRIKFHEAIEQENEKEIKDFIENNLSLKFIYSPQNITAMKKAIDTKKYKIYYYLKSFGLCASEFRNLGEVLDDTELSMANDQAIIQKTESISDALRNESKSVLILCTRSLIHNRKVKKEDETKYRKCIKKWLEDINKIADIMLDVAASCEDLVIIFDFESKFVDRTAFYDDSMGLAYTTISSRIFIGAKLGDDKREQEIKGVLAHELCHYVMCLVYDNKFLPYYKHATYIRDQFDGIVKSIDKWSTNDPNSPDDGCDGIISSVFTAYPVNCFHLELIVRPVQILVLYDGDPRKSQHLQEKYQNLFDFWITQVLPELHKYLQKNKVVIRVNTTVELLSSLSKSNIEFKASKDMEQLTVNKLTIVTTNVPKLLLINIHKCLQENYGCLLESQNVFIEPEKIKNAQVWKDLIHLHAKEVKLNIFVDCTKGKLDNLSSILNTKVFKLILVASNKEQIAKLNEICIKKKIMPIMMDINYNWGDLTEECQHKLLQTEITFQNNSKVSLIQLLAKNTNPDQNEVKEIIEDFSNTINVHAFNFIIDRQEISINSNLDDSNKINFEILFRNRNFLKKGINFKNEISQEKLISVMENKKHILISDIAGSGKSWVVKNISKIIMKQDPTRWVTFVDLKQFIEKFRKQPENLEFENYFIENILKPKTEFEAKIFKKLYKDGKVSIIFDGFDEIAPDCAEFVADLAKLFEFNDGNQLWIVTRDYFEVNLKKELKINNVYKLNDFTEEDGVKFIVSSWILMDFKDQKINNFEECLQSSPNLQEKAKKIVQKVTMSKDQSIGLPQLFSMIADGFKDDNIMLDDLKRAKIFMQFVNTMYTRWADFKGILRKEASVQSQDYELNFKELHQFFAILSLFPELIDSLFPEYDISEWPEVEIIAGGILNKIGSSYSFNHETFREYFVADFIFKATKKPKIKNEVVDLLIKILTIRKYGIIRMFLNEFIESSSKMDKVQLELEKSVENFNKMENLSEYFTENLEHLAKLVIEVLKKGNYENVKKILTDNISDVATNTRELKMFSEFTEFLFSYLSLDDLKDMINTQNILHKMIGSDSSVEIFEYFVSKLEERVGGEIVQKQLKLMPSEPENGNIFYHLGRLQNLSENKVQKYLEIFQKYLDDSEIVELMEKCTRDGKSILKIIDENIENLPPFLNGVGYDENSLKILKNIIIKTDLKGENILHWCAYKRDIDLHTSLWNLIQKIFVNQEELGYLVLQKDELENNFLHILLVQNSSETIEFTIKRLKEKLSESDYREILRSKGYFGQNLLQLAAYNSKEVKTHHIFWKELRDSCKSDQEFLKILEEVDEDGDNVFNIAAAFTTSEIFEFMEGKLTETASRDEIRKLFIKLGNEKENLLHTAAQQNKSFEFHKTLWKILQKYFDSAEILEFIKNRDIYGTNLLIDVIGINTEEIIEFTWKKVKELLNNNNLITDEHKENIQKYESIIKNSSGPKRLKRDQREILKLKWIKNENSEASKLFNEEIQRLVEKNLSKIKLENLHFFEADKNVENHEKLWENLVKIYTNRADLKKLLSEKTQSGDNFIHLIVTYNTADVIEFTINKLREIFSDSDYQEILRSKGEFGMNLLQLAACNSKEVKTHQILWKELRDSCKSEEQDEEFLEILREVDEDGDNIFHLAAAFTSSQIFEFMEEKLTETASRDEIRKLFIKLGNGNRNLLQAAAQQNKSLELHKTLWKNLRKYFNSSEILEFIKHPDVNKNNLLFIARKTNTKEILELTWTEVEKVITLFDEPIQDILRKSLNVRSFDDLKPMVKNKIVLDHEILWEHLLKIFENKQDLAKLLLEKDQNDRNFIHLLVIKNSADVIELTLNKFKENLNESDYQEILRSKGNFGMNLLQLAAYNSKEVKTHQILFKEFREFCKSDQEFLEILAEVDKKGDNILNISATLSTGEIFELILKELEKIALPEKIKKTVIKLGYFGRNLLQGAARQNKSLELHKALWKVLEKYFKSAEILQFIKHRDDRGWNVLLNVIKNTKEVKELTWNKVNKILTNIGYENNENFKKCEEIMKKVLNSDKLTKEEKQIIKLGWIDNKNFAKLFEDKIQLRKKISDIFLEDLKSFVIDENVENHENLWKYLEESLESYKDLKKLLFEKDENGYNLIHLLVAFNTADVIEYTLNKFKENLIDSDYHEILRSKGQLRRKLLQVAACVSKEVKTHRILWKELRDSCKSDQEFLKILEQTDSDGDNVFHLAAAFTTSEIFEFMISEIEKLTKNNEIIRKLLKSFGKGNRNLLQSVVIDNKSLQTNKTVWKIILEYFKVDEILEFIQHCNDSGNNLLCCAVICNTKEIVEFTWNQIKLFINTKDAQVDYLKRKGEQNNSLYQLSLENHSKDPQVTDWVQQTIKEYDDHIQLLAQEDTSVLTLEDLKLFIIDKNVENHEKLWENLVEIYASRADLKKLLFEKDQYGDNFIHLLVASNKFNVIEFTINKLREIFNESDYQEILRSKGQFGRNLLQRAACASKEVKTHQILWKAYRDSCKSDQEFLKILEQTDSDGDNVFHLAAACTTSEVFEFMISELEKLPNKKDVIRKLLTLFGQYNLNLLQSVATDNKSLETNKSVWKIICKYFDGKEILEFIEYCDEDGDNLLCNVVIWNTKEIVEFTWNQIKLFINTKDAQVEYLNRKGHQNQSLHQLSLENQANDTQVADWVQQTKKEYEIQ